MKLFAKYPWILSLLLVLMLAAWLASGILQAGPSSSEQPESKAVEKNLTPKVRTRQIEAQTINTNILLYGRTEANRSATLRAEISGRVIEILAPRGQRIKQGTPIIRLSVDDRKQQLDFAKAQLQQRQIEFEGSKSLSNEGYQGKAKLAQSYAALKESEALVARLEKEITNSLIKAPFNGVIDLRHVEVGDYVSIGDPVAIIQDHDPMIVRGDASQQDIQALFVGQKAKVRLTGKRIHQGEIRYLASTSDAKTNTFRVEVSIPNSKQKILAGLSAEMELALEEVEAQKISPALFSLDEDGVIGIKWVKENIVQFTPVNIVKSESDGVWITGLDRQTQLITVGQAFVRKGDVVESSPETSADS